MVILEFLQYYNKISTSQWNKIDFCGQRQIYVDNLASELSELCRPDVSVPCTIFWPSEIPWCVDKCLTEGWWWWYSETSEITILCSIQTQRHFWSVLSCSKKTLFRTYCMPMYACQLWRKLYILHSPINTWIASLVVYLHGWVIACSL